MPIVLRDVSARRLQFRSLKCAIVPEFLDRSLEDWKRLHAANILTVEELRSAIRELAGHQSERLADTQ